MDQTARSRVEHRSIVEWGNHGFVLLVRYRWREPASSGYADSPMALPLGASEVFQAVEFDSAGDVGHAWLAVPAPGEIAGLPGLAGAGSPGAVTDEEWRVEDLQQEGGQRQVKLVRGEKPP